MKSPSFFLLIILLLSCNKKSNENKVELIKVGYYPAFYQHSEIILNLNDKYLLFYNPSQNELPPPPPPPKNASKEDIEKLKIENEKYLKENPKFQAEFIKLNDEEVKQIQKVFIDISPKDLQKEEGKFPILDGANMNLVVLYTDKKLYSISNYEGEINDKTVNITSSIYKLLKEKSTSKVNQMYFNRKIE